MENQNSEKQFSKGVIPPAPPIEKLEIFPLETRKNEATQRTKDIANGKKENFSNDNELPKIKNLKNSSTFNKNGNSIEKKLDKLGKFFIYSSLVCL